MDLKAIQRWRQTRLAALAKEVGGNADLGRLMGFKDGAYIGQMVSGHRPITEATVAKAESVRHEKLGMRGARGWFSPPASDEPAADGTPLGPASPGERFDAVTEQEHDLLENWRWLTGRKKKELFDQIAQLAAERIEELQELYSQHPELQKVGLQAIPRTASARAALAAFKTTATAAPAVDPRQPTLFNDPGDPERNH